MRKSWPFALAVIVIGALAGLAIAGRPVPADSFVLDPSITVPIDASSTTSLVFATTTTTPAAATTTVAPTTTEVTTTSAAATTTEAPTTTVAPTTSIEQDTTTTTSGLSPRKDVRLVIANGDGRFKLASVTADRIRPLGYIIDLGDAIQTVDATIIYYRPGFDEEAAIVAIDISVPDATLAPLPTSASQAITNSDGNGDVVVVLGPDAPR